MTIRFDNRVAIVTGAGAGLGKAHALLLASRGAKVVVNDLSPKDGNESQADVVVQQIRESGGEAIAVHESVADPAAAQRIVDASINKFGRLDILVNNAGVLRDKTFAKMTLDDFELVLKVHLLGTVYVTKAAWPHMLSQRYGRIVFTSSASGLGVAYGQSNYGAAKAGMIGLMVSLKSEGAKSNIMVNAINPLAATQLTQGILPEQIMRISAPEHVSPAVAWLCSEECKLSGEIISAGAGHYARIKVMKSRGVLLDPQHPATIEQLASHLDQILDLSELEPYAGTLDSKTKEALGV